MTEHERIREWLGEVEGRHGASTKGLWKDRIGRDDRVGEYAFVAMDYDDHGNWENDSTDMTVEDADFIAHAHQDIPLLTKALGLALDGLERIAVKDAEGIWPIADDTVTEIAALLRDSGDEVDSD